MNKPDDIEQLQPNKHLQNANLEVAKLQKVKVQGANYHWYMYK